MLISQSSAADIIAHWADRRCDLDVMMSAFYYKPANDIRSASQFTTDNFTFCVGSKTETYLHSLFGSLFEVLRKQMGAADIMTEVMTSLKTSLSSIYTYYFKKIIDETIIIIIIIIIKFNTIFYYLFFVFVFNFDIIIKNE